LYASSNVAGADLDRGLDNAGKTTIVKRIMEEDVNSVSPTLGFIIKTIDYEGQVFQDLLFRTYG
jgi:GTPase SAR1 family protein